MQNADLTAQVNGVETAFAVGSTYDPGSLVVVLNGRALRRTEEYVENAPLYDGFSLLCHVPRVGDHLLALYTVDAGATLYPVVTATSYDPGF